MKKKIKNKNVLSIHIAYTYIYIYNTQYFLLYINKKQFVQTYRDIPQRSNNLTDINNFLLLRFLFFFFFHYNILVVADVNYSGHYFIIIRNI